MASHDVFISYSSQDKVSADAVCHGLEARGVRCWIAPRDVIPGSDWQTSLLDAISDAKATVLVFTAHTNSSDHIKREITAAFEGGAVVIPFRLENVTPQGSLRYHLTGVHWLDAYSGELDGHIEQLASTVKRILERPPAPGAGPVLTPELGPGAAATVAPVIAAAAAATPQVAPTLAPTRTPSQAPVSRPASAPAARPAMAPSAVATPAKGGVKPWMIAAGGAVAILLVVGALVMMGGGDEPTQAATTPAQTGPGQVEIGVQSLPDPQGASTPLPTLEGPVQDPAGSPGPRQQQQQQAQAPQTQADPVPQADAAGFDDPAFNDPDLSIPEPMDPELEEPSF